MPLFTVVTITFNNRGGLHKTATSIQSQTFSNYEWIIIDGASNDGTADNFINYPSAKIISEADKGIYDAMNKGIEHATGDYIIFMNAGDIFSNKNVLNDISNHCAPRPDFIYGDAEEDGHLKRARSHSKTNWGMFTHHQAMFYNRRALAALRYNLNFKIAADYDLTLRFLKTASQVLYVPIPVCVFEMGGASQTHAKLGRDEQFLSRRQSKSCSAILNHIIRIGQISRYALRQYLPKIYWGL